jgi:hypothetical protein
MESPSDRQRFWYCVEVRPNVQGLEAEQECWMQRRGQHVHTEELSCGDLTTCLQEGLSHGTVLVNYRVPGDKPGLRRWGRDRRRVHSRVAVEGRVFWRFTEEGIRSYVGVAGNGISL